MDTNKICTVCNKKLDEVNYLKHRTVCKTCYNKNRRKNNIIQKSKVLITMTMTIEPQTLSLDEALELLEAIKSKIPRNTISSRNLELLDLIQSRGFRSTRT